MSATSKLVRLFALTAFMFFVSCSNQAGSNTEMERLELQTSFSKGKGGDKEPPSTVDLMHHYSFNDVENLARDFAGNHDLLNVEAAFSEESVAEGSLFFEKGSYAQLSESRQRTGYFHDKIYAKSYSVWFKADRTDKSHFIIEEGGRINSMGLRIRKNKLMAGVTTRGQKNRVIIKTPFSDTQEWHHAAVVFDNGTLSLYLDGELVETKEASFDYIRNHPNGGAIGARYGRSVFNKKKFPYYKKGKKGKKKSRYIGGYFYGNIDEVKVFDGALTADMITDIYEEFSDNGGGHGGGGER